ncbi:tyrosine-type recombinase/integrase [Vibrio cholerae]|uniref:tyrosine-type recombinase/integrase n=1 Tax=Vibrio cholerae TaxID=666 RepID=UPI002D88C563|nr:tyrosine-type recombinase/integrase [Vibrio cholerae]MEB5516831.1 tyrosine-type recombinase/integrase [Vibrio cholerae]
MISQENLSNRQEVNKRSHYDSLSLSVFSSNPSETPKVPKVKHLTIQTSGHPQSQSVYFTTLKKHNTFYLRVSQRAKQAQRERSKHRDQLQNASVTVSLRTESRREAKMRSDYLKDRLLEQAGSFIDFNHMRETLKEIAQAELVRRPKVDWFYRGNIIIAQEALQEAQTVEQVRFIQSYADIMQKGLQSDTEGLLSIIDSNDSEVSSERSKHSEHKDHKDPKDNKEPKESLTIDGLIDNYIADKISSGEWMESTKEKKGAKLQHLKTIFEACSLKDKPIDKLTRNDLLEVRSALINRGLKTLTVNGYMQDIRAIFNNAEALGLIVKSPAVKLNIKDRDIKEPKALTESEVIALIEYFKHGYFTEARRSKKTLEGMKYLKWVPQIAAVTGARLNEILQLRKGDIRQSANGLCWYIDINDRGDNVVKNKSSNRIVPLVDGAYGFDLELFLSEVVNTCNEDSDNIFRLKNSERTKNTSRIIHQINEYRKNRPNSVPENLTMHSLRHTMATLCLNKKMPESFAKEILGHTQSITYGLYGSAGVDVETMYEEMVKLFK